MSLMVNTRRQTAWRFLMMAAASALFPALPHARAASITFTSGPRTFSGAAVNVSAQFDFDTTNHTITLNLLNLEINPTSLEQLIAGVKFTVAGAGSSLVPTIASSDVHTFDVDSGGVPATDSKNNTWSVSASGTQVSICTICASSSGHELLIGGPKSSNGKYNSAFTATQNSFIIASGDTYANGALHGLDSTPSWVFSIPSITSAVKVTSVTFDFGTTYGDDTMELSPEPGPLATMLGGLALILIGVWKRKRRG